MRPMPSPGPSEGPSEPPAGGSPPALTTTADKSDIVSIYWDADNQTAFAVISQNF